MPVPVCVYVMYINRHTHTHHDNPTLAPTPIHKHVNAMFLLFQERHPDLQAEQEARAAEYRAAAKAVKREQERLVRACVFWGGGGVPSHVSNTYITNPRSPPKINPQNPKQEKEERKRREEEAKLRSYESLMAESNMESNKKRAATADVSAALELEDDFM